jgi:lysozyme
MDWRNRALLLAAPVLVAGLTQFEGLRTVGYMDNIPVKPTPTICYGSTTGAVVGARRSVAECNALLKVDLTSKYGPAVLDMVTVELTQGQLDALTDFAYNLGISALRKSTLLKKVNASDFAGAALEFGRYRFAGGKDCRIRANGCYGIVTRRIWERTTFVS